jgi:predicted nucleic acid-binding protein
MPQLLWDASALIKRYALEVGTETVNALFASRPAVPTVTAYLSYAETCASLRRKLNGGVLDLPTFSTARLAVHREILLNPAVALITVDDAAVLSGIELTDRHNLNSTDAAILAACLRYAQSQPSDALRCILVASDHRLLRAADAEGLRTLNPELLPASDVPAFLANSDL